MPLRKEIKLLRRKAERFREEIRIHHETQGLRGILAISANLVCGYPKQVAVTAPGIKHPLFIRLRTSDAEVYEDVILEKEYDCPTSFSPRTVVDEVLIAA